MSIPFRFLCLTLLVGGFFTFSACGTAKVRKYTYKIVHTYPHDKTAYCQGLLFDGGALYESTGQKGASTLRKVELETGKVLQTKRIHSTMFGEGLTLHDDQFYHLTWKAQKGHVFDRDFQFIRQVNYRGEGWGLTSDGTHLIMSNGTSQIAFRDPKTFKTVRTLKVMDGDRPISQLNELEYINGEIWANIWKSDQVIRIHPKTGKVTAWIDFSGLLPKDTPLLEGEVLNGIAWDPAKKRLFVTGKHWPSLFEVELVAATE